ncbi:MAG: tRNA (N6-threonylcarbamoyladenosine(37)-N6)-methyltransferase TrmO [Thermodesulfobacteriota bacterium]
MNVTMTPIGVVHTDAVDLPRHWSLSNVEGTLEINPEYAPGLRDIEPGQKIVVLFHFHKSPPFSEGLLFQTPPHKSEAKGVFSICSPRRPNPIGLSVVEVTGVQGNTIDVRGIDMFDGTPILDIKPHITGEED